MKYTFLLLVFGLLFTSCMTMQYTVEVPKSVDMPKKVLFLSQSGTQASLYQTVIDLENNEMVILEFSGNHLSVVYRTGVILDPADYRGQKVVGTDAPVKSSFRNGDSSDDSRRNTDGTPDRDGNPANNI